ncbi:Hypothetical predicted protein, partial [Pelobates cultripes]
GEYSTGKQTLPVLPGGAAKKSSRAQKENRWRKIVAAVNAVGGNNRTEDVVKKR